jgi:arylsulfatase A
MKPLHTLFCSLLALVTICPSGLSAQTASKPNIIYILADDLGYGETGYNGQTMIKTPELDALAAKGMQFTSHYCGNSVCAPTRCSLMTGLHPGHAYIRANSPGYPNGQTPLPAGTETVATLMKRAGYATAIIGKWGLGGINPDGKPNSGHPNQQGFDHFFGYLDQRHAHEYYPEHLIRNTEEVPLNNSKEAGNNDYSHDLMTEEAVEWIKAKKDHPFFLYLAYCIPHTKWQVPELGEYAEMDWPKENYKIQAAMISRMDRDIGRIARLVEELGLAENTLITFNSDNGAHGQGGTREFFSATGALKGKKRSMYEGGVRSPMIAYWPGKVPAGTTSDHMSAFWDWLPTMAELTGEPLKGKTDGLSMLPTLLGKDGAQKKHKYLYWELYEGKPNCAVRLGNWKGVVTDRRKGIIELYDLSKDESEMTDLADQYPEIVERIRKAMLESHEPSPFWDKDNKPLYNVEAACKANGLEPPVKKKKTKKQK